jgi:aryl-alcohol dehydrogenase-like predicted oxidoreductase
VREYTYRSLENLRVEAIDLQQFHAWNDEWADDERWQRVTSDLKAEGLVRAIGISVNRWEPWNVLRALDTGIVDSVQVVYNIFEQAPEDSLFAACQARGIGVIARVPFDEGSLTGTLTPSMTWQDGDFRNLYFTPENLEQTLHRVERLRELVPAGMDLPEVALRFILEHSAVTTTIPGMRRPRHVERNLKVSDGASLPADVYRALGAHRWDRTAVLP